MIKIKQITLGKDFKKGLPNFSNISARCDITWEFGEDEEPDFDKMWDTINQQLEIQGSSSDPSWIKTTELKNEYKTVIKSKKGGE
jgi:hypothetical protein